MPYVTHPLSIILMCVAAMALYGLWGLVVLLVLIPLRAYAKTRSLHEEIGTVLNRYTGWIAPDALLSYIRSERQQRISRELQGKSGPVRFVAWLRVTSYARPISMYDLTPMLELLADEQRIQCSRTRDGVITSLMKA